MKGVEFSAADLDAWIAGESTAQPAGSRARRLTPRSAIEYVRAYINADLNPTIDRLRDRAKNDGIVGGREIYEPEFRNQMSERGHIVRRGRRRKSETPAN
jgi:hypothetical protein